MKWISVKERFPEVGEWVLCGHADDDWVDLSEMCHNGHGNIIFWNRECEIFPTHWMPLLEPPK